MWERDVDAGNGDDVDHGLSVVHARVRRVPKSLSPEQRHHAKTYATGLVAEDVGGCQGGASSVPSRSSNTWLGCSFGETSS